MFFGSDKIGEKTKPSNQAGEREFNEKVPEG
jgi:hypothetical protein